MGLVLAGAVIGELECLNRSLQRKTQTISGMKAAVSCVQYVLKDKRNEEAFQSLFEQANVIVNSLNLKAITVPELRQPPKRFRVEGSTNTSKTATEHYRDEFYQVLDVVEAELNERFQQEGILTLQKIENTLLTGQIDSVCDEYPEINSQLLAVQLPMFRHNYQFGSSMEAADILKGFSVDVRGLFSEVETLVRLLLVVPVSSSEAERSFSALRRLKTWPHSSMSQKRQNHVTVCHVHQDKLDLLDKKLVCQQFVAGCARLKQII